MKEETKKILFIDSIFISFMVSIISGYFVFFNLCLAENADIYVWSILLIPISICIILTTLYLVKIRKCITKLKFRNIENWYMFVLIVLYMFPTCLLVEHLKISIILFCISFFITLGLSAVFIMKRNNFSFKSGLLRISTFFSNNKRIFIDIIVIVAYFLLVYFSTSISTELCAVENDRGKMCWPRIGGKEWIPLLFGMTFSFIAAFISGAKKIGFSAVFIAILLYATYKLDIWWMWYYFAIEEAVVYTCIGLIISAVLLLAASRLPKRKDMFN